MQNATVTIVGGTTFESVASSELYSSPPYIEVPGALAAGGYDLPDLMAAALHRSAQTLKMQLWNPTDTNGLRLSSAKAQQVYGMAVHGGAIVSVANVSVHEVVQRLLMPNGLGKNNISRLKTDDSTSSTANGTPPNTSLATMPIAYFGGHHTGTIHKDVPCSKVTGCRPKQNIAMLAKMRLVMMYATPRLAHLLDPLSHARPMSD